MRALRSSIGAVGLGLGGVLALAACGTTTPSTTSTTAPQSTTAASSTTTSAPSNMGGMNMGGQGGGATHGSVHISSVSLTGTTAAPLVTVKGSGFGSQPAPDPPYAPQGNADKQGCPAAPVAGDGYLYGTSLHFADTKAKVGSYTDWNAGEYTSGNSGQFDCVGEIIKSWTPTQVVFSFGNIYDKPIPQNTYIISNGDQFEVYLKGASAKGTAHLTG